LTNFIILFSYATTVALLLYSFVAFIKIKSHIKTQKKAKLIILYNNNHAFSAISMIFLLFYFAHPYLKGNLHILIFAIIYAMIFVLKSKIIIDENGIFNGIYKLNINDVKYKVFKNKIIILEKNKVLMKLRFNRNKRKITLELLQELFITKENTTKDNA